MPIACTIEAWLLLADNVNNKIKVALITAKKIIAEQCVQLPVVQVDLLNALNYALAEDIFSPIQFPAFRQSSMDGYAIYWEEKANPLFIQAAMPAGTEQPVLLQKGKAIQVFTGGPIPDGANCVVQKEWVTVNNSTIEIQLNNNIQLGDHIRNIGSDLQKNTLLLQKHTVIQPSHIALMASAGSTTVKVLQKPSVGILITGNELVQPGNTLAFGKVYDSNAITIQAHLKKVGITLMQVRYVSDNLQ
jgi:molybdopterin molybdotransferase